MTYETLLTHTEGRVAVIALNRPKQLNALNDQLMNELGHALQAYEADDHIHVIVLTGNEKAFAAGADIPAMAELDFAKAFREDFVSRNWEHIRRIRKPVIGAVRGFALGGGCELAMMCDMLFAAEDAKFGQPEVKLGVIPGAGGTQRLPNAIGKAKAMDLLLTGRFMDAQEAERAGLVSRVVPADRLMEEVMQAAQTIASYSTLAVMAAKESVNRSFESGLSDGVMYERRLFHALFSTQDQKEGMAAFLEKRPPTFKNQ